MRFTKMEGCGNDYVYIDCFRETVLDASALAAFDYVERADPKRVFAFRLEDKNSLAAFCAAAEGYLLYHLERGFPTLENYKKLAALAPKPTE